MTKYTQYVSEETEFMRSLFRKNPALPQEQKELRSTWWDRDSLDEEQQREYAESNVKQPGYVYYSYKNHAQN